MITETSDSLMSGSTAELCKIALLEHDEHSRISIARFNIIKELKIQSDDCPSRLSKLMCSANISYDATFINLLRTIGSNNREQNEDSSLFMMTFLAECRQDAIFRKLRIHHDLTQFLFMFSGKDQNIKQNKQNWIFDIKKSGKHRNNRCRFNQLI
jgi:hypothetical protein